MRILVCGSRTYDTWDWPLYAMIEHIAQADDVTVIHGSGRGVDTQFGTLAALRGMKVEEYPADWKKHGRAAGPIRNQQMLRDGNPDLVLAFVDKPLEQSKGTADMVRRAREAGIAVYVVQAVVQAKEATS